MPVASQLSVGIRGVSDAVIDSITGLLVDPLSKQAGLTP